MRLFFYPAGMMRLEEDSISLARHFIAPQSDFENNGLTINPLLGGTPLTGL